MDIRKTVHLLARHLLLAWCIRLLLSISGTVKWRYSTYCTLLSCCCNAGPFGPNLVAEINGRVWLEAFNRSSFSQLLETDPLVILELAVWDSEPCPTCSNCSFGRLSVVASVTVAQRLSWHLQCIIGKFFFQTAVAFFFWFDVEL